MLNIDVHTKDSRGVCMTRWILLFLAGGSFAGVLAHVQEAGADGDTSVLRARRILVVSVVDRNPSEWSKESAGLQSRTIKLKVTLDQALKGGVTDAPFNKPVEVEIRQERYGSGRIADGLGPWSEQVVEKGSKFILFSESEEAQLLQTMLNPSFVANATSDPVMVADLQLVLDITGRNVAEQEKRLRAFRQVTPKNHGLFLAEYLSLLAKKACSEDGSELAKMLGQTDKLGLTETARRVYLDGLRLRAKPSLSPSDSFLSLYLRASISALRGEDSNPASSALEGEVFQIHLQNLAQRQGWRKVLERGGASPEEIEQLRSVLGDFGRREKLDPTFKATLETLCEKMAPEDK